MPELAKKLIFVCSPLAGQHIITLVGKTEKEKKKKKKIQEG